MSKNQAPAQRARAAINEVFKGDGGKMPVSRTESAMNGVASRLSVVLLKGPLINPSIKGIIAAEAINEVKRKSAFLKILKTAESPAMRAEHPRPSLQTPALSPPAQSFPPESAEHTAAHRRPEAVNKESTNYILSFNETFTSLIIVESSSY